MGATLKIFIISAAILIPWGIIRIVDLETRINSALLPLIGNDYVVMTLLVIPPLALWLVRWLFEPRGKRGKVSSENKSIVFRFRG